MCSRETSGYVSKRVNISIGVFLICVGILCVALEPFAIIWVNALMLIPAFTVWFDQGPRPGVCILGSYLPALAYISDESILGPGPIGDWGIPVMAALVQIGFGLWQIEVGLKRGKEAA